MNVTTIFAKLFHTFFLSDDKFKDSAPLPDSEIDTELELDTKKWRYRRSMAFSAFNVLVLITIVPILLSWYSPAFALVFKGISEFVSWSQAAFTSICGAYMGLSTWSEIHKNKIASTVSPDTPEA